MPVAVAFVYLVFHTHSHPNFSVKQERSMKLKLAAILTAGLLSVSSGLYAQGVATDVDKAAKDTGHATKTAAKDTAKGTEKAADKTGEVTEKAAKKTGHGIKKGAKDVGHGVKKGAEKTEDKMK